MQLANLLNSVTVIKIFQTQFGKMAVTHDVVINKVEYDSREISRGDMFVALRGKNSDGHKFIQDAIANGAKVVVVEDDNALPDSFFMHTGVVKIVVGNSRKALAILSANYCKHPADKLKIIGVTGTNGKTTATHIIKSLFEEKQNNKIGLIGTIENKIGDKVIPSTLTTPESLELQKMFLKMNEAGCSTVVMEVSSHALHQNRVFGINFAAGVFTNLTQDHLDYHGSMEEYFKAKKILFDNLDGNAVAITNYDDEYGLKIVESSRAKLITYGTDKQAEVFAENIQLLPTSTTFTVNYQGDKFDIESPLVGKFNVYNILAAISTALAFDIKISSIQHSLATIPPVRGRFENIVSPKGWRAIIDYAHTPDALMKCLLAIRDLLSNQKTPNGKIITVFGAGGDRDKTKRPIMGKIASELSDVVILTSDNPRSEDPYKIIADIAEGIKNNSGFFQEVDRQRAIEKAVELVSKGDIILIAGKGHENYQIIGNKKNHFNDREVVEEIIRQM
ncbi:MAG: UDP-N-acetylmuramoyl-L-alanyl-D-glutamate--2,6-diaminopimelate ligase [Bacteroidota bacterium]|nr:UDP-N-acetylmuramoyl-L-alanyl-D-glutamate--2,6-diaminopimelate ligase [Bacteroidota bacterium]